VEENVIDELKGKDTEKNAVYTAYKEEEELNIDLLIIIGGDGSILWALQYFHHRITPPILAYSKVRIYSNPFSFGYREHSIIFATFQYRIMRKASSLLLNLFLLRNLCLLRRDQDCIAKYIYTCISKF